MFEIESFIDKIFLECIHRNTFKAEELFSKFLPPEISKEDKYYCEKQITDALNFLERKSLITGQLKPEYTKNMGLLMEVRHGGIGRFGNILATCPKSVRLFYYWITSVRLIIK